MTILPSEKKYKLWPSIVIVFLAFVAPVTFCTWVKVPRMFACPQSEMFTGMLRAGIITTEPVGSKLRSNPP